MGARLRLDFIGSSVLEMIADAGLTDRTIATIKLMCIIQLLVFNMFEAAAWIPYQVETPLGHEMVNLKTAAYRLQKMPPRIKIRR